MTIQGDVISYGIIRGGSSRRHLLDCDEVPVPNPAYDGYGVQFRFQCVCGEVHAQNASNVWPTGDSNCHFVETQCPTSNARVDIELLKPGSLPSKEDLLNRELRRSRQQGTGR